MSKLWRYKAGRRGYNLVTVYERTAGGPIWIEWWPHGKRKREPLTRIAGRPVLDRKIAMAAADRLAGLLEQHTRKDQMTTLLGLPEPRTLAQLLADYHAKRGAKWSPSNRRSMEAMREFWERRLGSDTDVRRLAGMAAEIEAIARSEAKRRKWSPRTEAKYLKYLITAVNYGQKKLKWYGPDHNLSAVDVPRADGFVQPYTDDEIRRLLVALEQVDLRAAVAGWIAYTSLRRISAIRTLPLSAWRTMPAEGEVPVGFIRFPRTTDKAKKQGEPAVAGRAVELIDALAQTPAAQASGLLLPGGDLNDPSPDREPVRYETLHDWLHEAERIAEIEHIDGRAWHQFKSAATTAAEEEMGDLSAASDQAGTLKSTLESYYVKRDPKARIELARRLAKRAAGA